VVSANAGAKPNPPGRFAYCIWTLAIALLEIRLDLPD